MQIRRLLKEPLLHFVLIGIALFVVHGLVAAPERAGTTIVISEAIVDEIAREHQARWARKPTDQELASLIDAYVRDEILYREGVALGLERDDAQIKRRVRQKFEVIAEEQSAGDAPSDAELNAYVARNASRFLLPGTLSFEQIFVDARNPDAARAVAVARAAVLGGADPSTLGQASMLPARVENMAQDLVVRDFGAQFVRQTDAAPIGEWSGPITSSFGTHLVRVSARTPSVLPEFASIRQAAAREWENERRAAARSDSYKKLRERYTVVIEAKKPPSVAAQ